MKNIGLMVVVVWLLSGAAACHRNTKAEQLAALDSAYQSGVFTKEEYEAEKLALTGSPPAPAPAPAPAIPADSAPVNTPSSIPPAPVNPPAAARAEADDLEPAPLAGCEDAEYKSDKVKGQRTRFFPAPVSAVRKAALQALKNLDFNVHKDANNEMEASKQRHIGVLVGAGGERLLLRFSAAQQGNQSGTRVTGETKKSTFGRLAQKSWTSAVLAQIACNLGH
jgi:hypothetical protein